MKKVAIIGGGPAGIMAAITAARNGAEVILIEKNKQLGKKLLLTGKGRCNITNNQEDNKKIIEQFGKNGKFLFSALHQFNTGDAIKFFNDLGLATKVERGQRVFPQSDKAFDVLNVLQKELKRNKVKLLLDTKVIEFVKQNNSIDKIVTSSGEIIVDEYIIATGGLSYPLTGSTGDGYAWALELGHQIVKLRPSLVPILVQEWFLRELEGLSLKNVKISIFEAQKCLDSQFGEALFTSKSISGPIIIDLSKKVGELLPRILKLSIDFKPALTQNELDLRLQKDFKEFNNKLFKNSLNKLLPKKLIPVIIKLSKIDPEKQVNRINKLERFALINLLKNFQLNVKGLDDFNHAIITCGGIDIKEVDPKTMRSKIINNLLFAGEILDLDGPTGGYNLQECWSTGYVAGSHI